MSTGKSPKVQLFETAPGRNFGGVISRFGSFCLLGAVIGLSAVRSEAQAPTVDAVGPEFAISEPDAQRAATPASAQARDQRGLGTINGVVADDSGSLLVGVKVSLTRKDQPATQEVVTGDDGTFSFANVAPGPFQVTVGADGFSSQTVSGTLHAGETFAAPQIVLTVASQKEQVTVSAGFEPVQVAEFQIQDQEKQRVLGVIPNFYVSYVPDAERLTAKQKYELAWKSSIDPFTFVGSAALAGIEQAGDEFNGYGQGMQGFGKRYGAAYGDVVIGTFLGSAVLPSLWKQDPRYFYKGTGSTRSRVLYALASPFICKGDNRKWQGNYSYVVGNLAGAGISDLYYPASDRNGASAVLETAFVRFGENALSALFQEFVFKKLTRHLPASAKADAQ
jgi:hypothetical protein